MDLTREPAPELPAWIAELVPFDRYRVAVDGMRVHVMETGDPNGRPVLLLHGNPTWGFIWRKVASTLARDGGVRVLMPDLIGLGFSDRPPSPAWHTMDAHARVIGGLVDLLDLRALVFCGQDWGGPIGLLALSQRRERLHGLVLANTGAAPPRDGFRQTLFHRFARWPWISDAAFRLLEFPQIALHRAQSDPDSIRGVVARAYRYPLRDRRSNHAPLEFARMVPDVPWHPSVAPLRRCEEFVRSFRGPAALVWGERDPLLGRLLDRHARMMPQARVIRTDAGHFLQEEVSSEVAAGIRHVVSSAG